MEDFSALRKLIRYQRAILALEKEWGNFQVEISHLQEIEFTINSKEENLVFFRNFLDSTQKALLASGSERGNLLHAQKKSPAITGEYAPASFSAMAFLRFAKHNLCILEKDFQGAAEQAGKIVDIYSENPRLIADFDHFTILMAGIFNQSMMQIVFNDLDSAEETIKKIRTIAKAEKRAPVRAFENETRFSITIARKRLDYDQGNTTILALKDQFALYQGRIKVSVEIELAHLAGIFYLIFGKPELSIPWIAQNINRKLGLVLPELLAFSRILFLVAHYENGNPDMVERGIRSAKSFYGKHQRLRPFEKTVLQNFNRLLKAQSDADIREVFISFESELQEQYQNGFEGLNNFFNLSAWIRSKIQRQPMEKILREEFSS